MNFFGNFFGNTEGLNIGWFSLANIFQRPKMPHDFPPCFRAHTFNGVHAGGEGVFAADRPVVGFGVAVDFCLDALNQIEGIRFRIQGDNF